MSYEVITISIPQMPADTSIIAGIKEVLEAYGFFEVDLSIEMHTDAITYIFQKGA